MQSNATNQIIDGNGLGDLSQGPLQDGSAFVEDLAQDFFQLGVVGDEKGVDFAAGVVQVLARVVGGESKPIGQLAQAIMGVLETQKMSMRLELIIG